jgi:two-component system, cell cycle sensor histidine kinase and response regulator CckA
MPSNESPTAGRKASPAVSDPGTLLSPEQVRRSEEIGALGLLAGGVAHELNNLLTVIISYGELARSSVNGTPAASDLEEILHAAGRAASLTGQLLAFGRRQIAAAEVLDLNELVLRMESMLQPVVGAGARLSMSLMPGLGRVKVDPAHIRQVVLTLVMYARHSVSDGGRIVIETSNFEVRKQAPDLPAELTAGKYVLLTVRDNGPGLDPEQQVRLFEPFFPLKSQVRSPGLGLCTVYGIVKQNGGEIAVSSVPGRGTSFRIYFPRSYEVTADLKPDERETSLKGNETVLIVEDDPQLRKLGCHVLARYGYKIVEAGNGDEAVQIFKQHPGRIHLLFTDVVVPGTNGRDLARKLSAIEPRLKALYTSGYAENVIDHYGVLEPGIAFIQKPFGPETLARKVREVLDGTKAWGGAPGATVPPL